MTILQFRSESMSYFSEALSIVLTALMGYLTWYLKAQFSAKSATSKALKILLRREIYELHGVYMERLEVTPQELYEFTELTELYTNLGGNGTAKRMIDDVTKLPIRSDEI